MNYINFKLLNCTNCERNISIENKEDYLQKVNKNINLHIFCSKDCMSSFEILNNFIKIENKKILKPIYFN